MYPVCTRPGGCCCCCCFNLISPYLVPSTAVVSDGACLRLYPYQTEGRGPGGGGREDLQPQGADDASRAPWVLYHRDEISETSCRSGVHMCMCACACVCAGTGCTC